MGKANAVVDCDRPACDDMMNKLKKAAQAAAPPAQQEPPTTVTNLERTAAGAAVVADDECPMGGVELGRSTWGLLHSMAAWYPDQPTLEDQRSMVRFFSALARFYPCGWCARDFRANMKQAPVQAESRQELCQWLCRQHNVVNGKLGKPTFSCDMTALDRRWRTNDTQHCKARGGDNDHQ